MDLAPKPRPLLLATLTVFAQASLSACGGSTSPGGSTGGAQGVMVEVQPSTARVPPGGTQKFASSVTGTADTSVVWQVVDTGGGTVDATGLYVAPATPGTYRVRASSHADPTASGTATVTVTPVVAVTIAPSPASVNSCQSLTFTATVTGTTNTSVSWSVQEGAAGGTISSAGVYTAPSTAGTYHVVATSAASPTTSTSIPVTVTDKILGVAVSPQAPTVTTSGSVQFTATVTTTCGSFQATQAVN